MLCRTLRAVSFPRFQPVLISPRSTTIRSFSSTLEPPTMSAQITLNETEATFLDLLDEFAKTYVPPENVDSGSSKTVECRIAGGWVRDKLLSLPSSDLDIALSTASGHAFAVAFSEFLTTPPRNVAIGSIGKVAANPEQSKHLETATTRIMGLECDFVGLRSESYAEGSRIPDVVELGTPLQDALRRDLTINSLFYNVHTRSVEDWTAHGLQDLERRIARTPLPPLQTFQDDPLRILRLVRFASRFALTVETEVETVLKSGGGPGGVLEALRTKISKERVGIELYKMFKGPDPLHSLTLIHELNLYDSIFTIPPPAPPTSPQAPITDSLATARVLSWLLALPELHPVLRAEALRRIDMLWLACAVAPFRQGIVKTGKKEVKALELVVAEGLKLSSDLKLAASNLHTCAELFAHPELERYAGPHERSAIGTLLADSHAHQKPKYADKPSLAHWGSSITFAIVMRLLPLWHGLGFEDESQARAIVGSYTLFVNRAEALGVDKAIERPKVIDGKAIATLLSLPPTKVRMTVQRAAEAWQLDNPDGTAEECEAWLQQEWFDRRAEWEREASGGFQGNRKKAKKA